MSHESRIGVDYDLSATDSIRLSVGASMEQVFSPLESNILPGLPLSEKIYKAIASIPAKFRNGDPLPVGLNEKANMDTISNSVSQEIPIPSAVVIGTLLNPSARNPEREKAGLLGVLLVERLLQIDQQVRRVYDQGLEEVIIADDTVSHWLFDHSSGWSAVEAAQNNYLISVQKVIERMQRAYGVFPIRVVRESDLYKQQGLTFERYLDICDENLRAFEAYLAESDQVIKEETGKDKPWSEYKDKIEGLQSFDELQRLGWKGLIPPEMRDFFRQRITRSQQGLSEDMLDQQLARWFASTLTKSQRNVLQTAVNSSHYLRLSFVTTPPGVPSEFQASVGISAHPRTKGISEQKTTPPWRGIGYMMHKPERTGLRIRPTDIADVRKMAGVKDSIEATLMFGGAEISPFEIAIL